MITYTRIILDELTEIDWEGPGYYVISQQQTIASGVWFRWSKISTRVSGAEYAHTPEDLK